MTRRIVPIVEAHSEAASVPKFLRRILADLGVYDIEVDSKAIREHRQKLVNPEVFIKRLRMAALRPNCVAVFVLMDSDDDAACKLGPALLKVAADHAYCLPCRVVFAVRETEAWLLAGIESLRGYRGVRQGAVPPDNVEAIRGAKERLGESMERGYKSTIDQTKLLLKFDYQAARRRAGSLDKFLRDAENLVLEISSSTKTH